MNFGWEIVKFIVYGMLIVLISKYVLVTLLRKLAEALKLKPKMVGNIAGVATSVPELLTISFSSASGLMDASIYNVLSSNVINLIQYMASIILNKNGEKLKNKALKIDLFLVALTIGIPIIMMFLKLEVKWYMVPLFVFLFFLFYRINTNSHRLYLKEATDELEKEFEEEEKWMSGKKGLVAKYAVLLLITAIGLFVIGNLLSNALENLCNIFGVPEFVIGIALGFATSLPELITFFEAQRHYKKSHKEEEGVVEATNNLLTSNILNLFVIQSVGILIYILIGR